MSRSNDEKIAEAIKHHAAGSFEQAAQAYAALLRDDPRQPEIASNLSDVLRRLGRLPEAETSARRALELRPTFADARHNLSLVLEAQGRVSEAVDEETKAWRSSPQSSIFRLRVAHLHADAAASADEDSDAALHACRAVVEAAPELPEGWCNLGSVLHRRLMLDEAQAATEQAIALRPNFLQAHKNLASILLRRGEYARGWIEHEWRLTDPDRTRFPQPRWDGSDLRGRTILVHAEQGFGDAIHFARYLPMIKQRGAGRIILACRAPLKSLLSRVEGVDEIVTVGEAIPPCDCHLPLMSAPLVFQTGAQTIPARVPYLRLDEAKVRRWRDRVTSIGGGRKIGLAWTGNPKPDPNRTIPGELLAPLARVKDARWISLQVDARRNLPPASLEMIDWTNELHDFDDTAALVASLDRVISIETVTAHLAGAIARPTWTLLPHFSGWRWLHEREDSPWYPTMRLFRQSRPRDWPAVIERVANELASV